MSRDDEPFFDALAAVMSLLDSLPGRMPVVTVFVAPASTGPQHA